MPNCEEDVIRIGRDMDKLIKNGGSKVSRELDLLKALKELPITLEILQKTRIGMSVNSMRKQSNNEETISLAKSLIKGWKKLLPAQNSPSSSKNTTPRDSPILAAENSNNGGSSVTSSKELNNGKGSQNKEEPKSSRLVPPTNDSVRQKCREMITNALKTSLNDMEEEILSNIGDPLVISGQIEEAIYSEFKNADSGYKNRVRSRVMNLRDSKNPELRKNVLLGEISTEKFAVMTAEQMASNKMKELRQTYTKEGIRDAQLATTGGTRSSLLKCNKCKKRNCTYNQVQTRSADEPMTTFVFCNECGNRWKFC